MDLAEADRIVRMAWRHLPAAHRELLREIGAAQWHVVDRPLGGVVDDLTRSAGLSALERSVRDELDGAFGAWAQDLRLVLVNAAYPQLEGLDHATRRSLIARVAWHEWGHALSITRCTSADVSAGPVLLQQAPAGVGLAVRRAGYLSCEYTYELIAAVYALLMERRCKGIYGQPRWMSDDIYELMGRTIGWWSQ
jgi:hypothetical protein